MDEAKKLAIESGISAITVQAVASAAGVTKGGFLHHFPSKQALIDAIFEEVLDQLASEIGARASKDRVAHGAFTRAYIDLAFGGEEPAMDQTWIALSLLMLDDPALRMKWTEWLNDQLSEYGEDQTRIARDPLSESGRSCDAQHSVFWAPTGHSPRSARRAGVRGEGMRR